MRFGLHRQLRGGLGHFLGPLLDVLHGRLADGVVADGGRLVFIRRQQRLVLEAQPLDHAHQIAVLGIELADALRVRLIALDANSMTSWDLMLVFFKVLRDFFR